MKTEDVIEQAERRQQERFAAQLALWDRILEAIQAQGETAAGEGRQPSPD